MPQLSNLGIILQSGRDGVYVNDEQRIGWQKGAKWAREFVLTVLKENQRACKTLTDKDKARPVQEIMDETYDDLILIFSK